MSRKDGVVLIHIYCGDGKGKTTAALGQAVRCAGGGGRVLFFQFLKGNDSGERAALKVIPGIELIDGPNDIKFVWNMTENEKNEASKYYKKKFDELCAASAGFDMLVFDEIIPALKYGFVGSDDLLRFFSDKPKGLELVLTGRDPEAGFVDAADYVTRMEKVKHPFDKGIKMRKYIEI